jgi:hypothetical protein
MRSKFQYFNKILMIALVISLLSVVAILPSGCNKKVEKKGIIFVNAFSASALIDADTGKAIWDPLSGDISYNDIFGEGGNFNLIINKELIDEVMSIGANVDSEDGLFEKFTLNEDGSSKYNIVAANMDTQSRLKYGPLNAYKEDYEEINKRYGSEYEVSIFQYDWRLDCNIASAQLETFIKNKGYTEIMLLSHSMGGHVISGYLARSQENRDLVKSYISYATPFLGSMDAFTTIEEVEEIVSDLPLVGDAALTMLDTRIKPLAYNMATVYQLMPYPEYMTSGHFSGNNTSFFTIDGQPMTDYTQYMNFISNREYSKTKDNQVRNQITSLQAYQQGHYIKQEDGSYIHVSKLINTHYFASTGKLTTISVSINDGELIKNRIKEGDGVVPLYSATCGLPLDDSRVVLFEGLGHDAMGLYFNKYLKTKTFEIMDAALSKQAKKNLKIG